ncbi:MAG: hypothetical protein AVO35_02070 [Candidatus Aegiribacteria sp. MLS_C]|nr:MAG: hypothetical protein AVO35_02070 [Candidatus Aegiribacteria sp. MLS_C]
MERFSLFGGSAILALLSIMSACGGSGSEEAVRPAEETGPDAAAGGISSDGVTLTWDFLEEDVTFTVSAPATGWVAVGFDASSVMLDGDMIIGYVENEEVFISDQWGDGYTSHSADSELGGTMDILSASGTETDGRTTISFTRPVATGDSFDHDLERGTSHSVMLAYGPEDSDGFTGRHRWVETFQVVLD